MMKQPACRKASCEGTCVAGGLAMAQGGPSSPSRQKHLKGLRGTGKMGCSSSTPTGPAPAKCHHSQSWGQADSPLAGNGCSNSESLQAWSWRNLGQGPCPLDGPQSSHSAGWAPSLGPREQVRLMPSRKHLKWLLWQPLCKEILLRCR